MRLLILISALFLFQFAGAQVNICNADPLPLKVLSIEDEKILKASLDSIYKTTKNGKTRSYKLEGDTTESTKMAFKDLQAQLLQLPKDLGVDSTATYKELFYETHSYFIDQFGNSSSAYSLNKRDSLIQGAAFYTLLKAQASRLQRVQSFSYGGFYLIIRVCNQYIGESSRGSATTYYFRKEK